MSGGLVILVFIAIAVVAGIFGHLAAEKRKKELLAWAGARGLAFNPERQYGFDAAYPGLACLQRGSNRYAYNTSSGRWGEREILACDYHYETHSTDSKGRRQTHHHHLSLVLLSSPVPLRPLFIRPEGFFDKITEFFGMDDIDFESAEFSRKFHVTAPDKRWAYDVLHQRAMEFLLAAPVYSIAFDGACAAAFRSSVFTPAEFEEAARVIEGLLALLPEYVLRQQAGPQPPPLPA